MGSTAQFKFFGPFFSAGALAAAPKLYHYVAGTTTLKDAWTDRAKTVTAAQPIVGDANGIISAYFDGLYKLVVKDSNDVTLYTWDNVDLEEVIDALPIVGGNLTGGVNTARTTVASAANPDIFAITIGNTIDYTGTATCTGFVASPQAGAQRTLVCAGAAVFTAGANMLIDGVTSGNNYTAVAGDKLTVIAVTTTQFRLSIQSFSGQYRFPETQVPSTHVNTLDDYEEGSWTPIVGGTATYTAQQGTYTKIGRYVFIRCSLVINVIGTGSTSVISGLPFAASSNSSMYVGKSTTLATNVVSIAGSALSTSIELRSRTAAAASDAVNAVLGNGSLIELSGGFEVA